MEHKWAGHSSNLAWLLWSMAESEGSRAAIESEHSACDYASLAERAAQIGHGLAAAGVRANDRVAVLVERGPDAAAAFFGAIAAGSIVININDGLRPRQIEHILNHSGATVLLGSASLLANQPRQLDAPQTQILTLNELDDGSSFTPLVRVGTDAAQIIYTSGSTGRPKGVTMSHGSLWASLETITGYLGITGEDRIGTVLPFSFTYGFNQLLCAIATGATLVLEDSPLAHTIVTNLKEREINVFAGVPALWLQLLGVPVFKEEPIESLRVLTNAGGHCPRPAVQALRAAQPQAKLFLMYGMTEVIRSTYLDPELVDEKPDCMGKAMPGTEIMVLRNDDTECQPGEVGELVHRGPTVALGYWDDPEGTAQTFRPNPLRPGAAPDNERVVYSGDLVRLDEEGYIYFVSRKDRLIKSLGYRVSPDEIQDVLIASGAIREVVVLGEPDERRGQAIVAYVVLNDEEDSLKRVKQFCRVELPRHMQPARFEVLDKIPRSAAGKHDYRALREQMTES